MRLKDKVAVIYGAGSVGGAVARAFAREGAHVFLTSRGMNKVDAIAKGIKDAGRKVPRAYRKPDSPNDAFLHLMKWQGQPCSWLPMRRA